MATMISNLEKNTGRAFSDWIAEVRGLGALKHGEVVAHLKTKHGLGHGYANLVAHAAKVDETKPAVATEDAVDSWFAGDKAAIRPIYDAVMNAIRGFGGDIEFAPKKGYMSLRRSKQFACVFPSTKTRVDVGIQLKGVEPAGRLEKSGSWNAMVSHRVRLESVGQVDAELIAWLRRAYDAA